jgi:hypothetical protein
MRDEGSHLDGDGGPLGGPVLLDQREDHLIFLSE